MTAFKKARVSRRRPRLVRVSVEDVRRFFLALRRGVARTLAELIYWSSERCKYQAMAMSFNYQARGGLTSLQP